jgi:hypothetical protein
VFCLKRSLRPARSWPCWTSSLQSSLATPFTSLTIVGVFTSCLDVLHPNLNNSGIDARPPCLNLCTDMMHLRAILKVWVVRSAITASMKVIHLTTMGAKWDHPWFLEENARESYVICCDNLSRGIRWNWLVKLVGISVGLGVGLLGGTRCWHVSGMLACPVGPGVGMSVGPSVEAYLLRNFPDVKLSGTV